MVGERFPEYKLAMNPGVSPVLQNLLSMEWGFPNSYIYSGDDKYRNGKYLTANLVYKDVVRKDNEPVEFGLGSDSYRICLMVEHWGGRKASSSLYRNEYRSAILLSGSSRRYLSSHIQKLCCPVLF